MSFLWPWALALLGVVAALTIAYVLMLRRKRKNVVRYSSLSLVKSALPKYSRLKRFLPVVLFLLGLTSLVGAVARPVSIVSIPSDQTTIVLAMDVSRSMCATDIEPNRLLAAEAAAINFVNSQKPGTQIGLVAFSGFAEVVQAPTRDREQLRAAIESLATGRRTAIGSGIMKSLQLLSEIDESVAPVAFDGAPPVEFAPMPKGAFAPHIIVLLTDGASNYGPAPVDAAQEAIDRGIRVYTIGFGTAQGSPIPNCGAQLVGREPGGNRGERQNGGFLQGNFRRGIDEETLKKVSAMTDAAYYSAESTDELIAAFKNLPTHLISRSEVTEIGFIYATIGALFILLAVLLAMLWQPLLM
jgi:Ca-activated chloride channel homolog